MTSEETNQAGADETPIQRAARQEQEAQTPEGQDARAEQEADSAIEDIEEYVAETDPASLPEAEAALNAWQIPTSPFEGVPADVAVAPDRPEEPLVVVMSAGTESEANIVLGLLESEGIAAMIHDVSMPAYGSIFSKGESRWGDILVPASQEEQARAIIAAAQQGNTE